MYTHLYGLSLSQSDQRIRCVFQSVYNNFTYFSNRCQILGLSRAEIKVGTDVRSKALGISGVNFCPGIRFWEVNFAWALDFGQFLTINV